MNKGNGIKLLTAALFLTGYVLAGCGGGGGSGSSGNPAGASNSSSGQNYYLSGTVQGLPSGQQVTLANDLGGQAVVNANGKFQLPTSYASDAEFRVTVASQPQGAQCSVSPPWYWPVADTDTSSGVVVSCTTGTALTTTVTGLDSSDMFMMQMVVNNTTVAQFAITNNGTFTFPYEISKGTNFQLLTGDASLVVCSPVNYSAVNVTGSSTNLSIICSPDHFGVSVTVTGASSINAEPSVYNNGNQSINVVTDGTYLVGEVAKGGGYSISTFLTPDSGVCAVVNGTGNNVQSTVNVQVNCSRPTETVAGNLLGLVSGTQISLSNNGGTPITLTENGVFSFPTPVAYQGIANVAIQSAPAGEVCAIDADGQFNIIQPVSNLLVYCQSPIQIASIAQPQTSLDTGITLGTDGNFYVVSDGTGGNGTGSIMQVTPPGVASVVYSFPPSSAGSGINPLETNLTLGIDGNLYGTTSQGGTFSEGTFFKYNYAGQYTALYSFGNSSTDAARPVTSLVLANDGNFYGISEFGGSNNGGAIFRIAGDGSGEQVIYSFSGSSGGMTGVTSLIQGSDGFLYGSSSIGGVNGYGFLFKSSLSGTLTKIRDYAYLVQAGTSDVLTNLVLGPGGSIYAAMNDYQSGSAGNVGAIVNLGTDGAAQTIVYTFEPQNFLVDGYAPIVKLLYGPDGNFYGITGSGGYFQNGVLFELTQGGVFTMLHAFVGGPGVSSGVSDAGTPFANLVAGSDGHLYGTASSQQSFAGFSSGGIWYKY